MYPTVYMLALWCGVSGLPDTQRVLGKDPRTHILGHVEACLEGPGMAGKPGKVPRWPQALAWEPDGYRPGVPAMRTF